MPPECTDYANFDPSIEVIFAQSRVYAKILENFFLRKTPQSHCLQILPEIEHSNYTVLHESPAEYLGKCCDKKVLIKVM